MTDFIRTHREQDPHTLMLQASKYPHIDMRAAAEQIAGWQIARHKLPSWAAIDGIIYPSRISMEQCSSEATASYKANLLRQLSPAPQNLIDLTGGFGVDFAIMSREFQTATYIEEQESLVNIARHNIPLLCNKNNITIIQSTITDYLCSALSNTAHTLIYIDPARRSVSQHYSRQHYQLQDCSPNVPQLLPQLTSLARYILIKLSPMADIAATVRELNSSVTEIHIVEHAAECKELLILIDTNSQPMPLDSIPHHVGDLIFTRAEEQQTAVEYCAQPRAQQYLYEPPAAILKAGCTKLIAHRYGIQKLSPDSHLYINNDLIPDFPGRSFQIETILDFNKSTIRQLSNTQANLTVRGFPSTVAQLRKQLKLRDGGNKYIFACTTASHHHTLLCCNRVP